MGDIDDAGRVWTVAELEQLDPEERVELIRRRHRRTLTFDDLDPAFAEEVRATARRLVAEHLGGDEADDT